MNELFWLWLSLSILLVLFIIIILTKLTILVNYYHHNDNDDLKIEFRVWFVIKYKINVPLIKIDDDSPSIVVKSHSQMGDSASENPDHQVNQITNKDITSSLQKTKEMLEKVFNLHVIVRKFFRKVTIKKLEWDSLVGIGDAAHTGMITGAIWALKGSIIGLLSHYLRLKQMPRLSVTPHFQAAVIQTRFSCMFQFRIGHAILAGLKLIKFWKGEKPRLKSNNLKDEKMNSV